MKNAFKALNNIMVLILLGTIIGLGIAYFKYLFSWSTGFTNQIIISVVILTILIIVFKLFIDQYKFKKSYLKYLPYLDNYELKPYIEEAEKAMNDTKVTTYQQIHRLNLSLGYAYQGEFQKAIDLLMKIYDHSKPMSELALICVIQMTSYYLYLDDSKSAKKLEEVTGNLIMNNETHPKYGLLIQINRLHTALLARNIERAKEYLENAENLQKLQKIMNTELKLLKVKYLFITLQTQQAQAILEELRALKLPPVFRSQIDLLSEKESS